MTALSIRARFLVGALFLSLLCHAVLADPELSKPRKVLFLYSSMGGGHLAAARGIEARIKAAAPDTEFVYKDMREFMPKIGWTNKIDSVAWLYLFEHRPELFDRMFKGFMQTGNKTRSLGDLKQWYVTDKFVEFVDGVKPDVIISTVYSGAQQIGDLREKGKYRGIPTAWLHTDYVAGYFPRVSKRIDMTFLPHQELEDEWLEKGVAPDRVKTTGMPVNPKAFEGVDRETFMRAQGLDPSQKMVMVAFGAVGAGANLEAIKRLANSFGTEPVQVVVVAGRNAKYVEQLEALKSSLPSNVRLEAKGFIPNEDLLGLIKSSDLYVTKAGGLSPTEGFAIGHPMIILSNVGAHEGANARLFEKLGLAVVVEEPVLLGVAAQRVLSDPEVKRRMLESQREFREGMNLDAVVEFALHGKSKLETPGQDFGADGGAVAPNAHESLEQLNRDAPHDVEIILSYASQAVPGEHPYDWRVPGGNPFGHICIRIGDKIYTVNPSAKVGEDKGLITEISYEHFFFGNHPETPNSHLAAEYGIFYNRNALGLRLTGISEQQKQALLARIQAINREWEEGRHVWGYGNNCADTTVEILSGAGLVSPKKRRYSMPLDVFEHYVSWVDSRPDLGAEFVDYQRHVDTQSPLSATRFPLSVYHPFRSLRHLIGRGPNPESIERRVTKRVGSYPGDKSVHYENVDENSFEKLKQTFSLRIIKLQRLVQSLTILEMQLKSRYPDSILGYQVDTLQAVNKLSPREFELLLENGPDTPGALELVNKVREQDQVLKDHHALYDAYNKMKLDFMMKKYLLDMDVAFSILKPNLTPKQLDRVLKLVNGARKYIRQYEANLHLYGQAKDTFRLSPAVYFFDVLRSFYLELDQIFIRFPADLSNKKLREEILSNMVRQLQHMGQELKRSYSFQEIAPFSPSLPIRHDPVSRLLKQLENSGVELLEDLQSGKPVGRTAFGRLSERWGHLTETLGHAEALSTPLADLFLGLLRARQKTGPNKTPISDAIYEGFRAVGDRLGIQVVIEGRENIPELKGPKSVNILALQHSHPVYDNIVAAHMGLDGKSAIFGNADLFGLGKWASDQFEKSDHFIFVGRGSDKPIEKTLDILKRGKVQNLVIFPEGSTSAGVYEVRPLRSKFSWGLIQRLRQEGYDVNITPVSLPWNFEIGSAWKAKDLGNPEHRYLKGIIEQPITSRMIDFLFSTTKDPESLNRLIREMYLSRSASVVVQSAVQGIHVIDGKSADPNLIVVDGIVPTERVQSRMLGYITSRAGLCKDGFARLEERVLPAKSAFQK